MSKLKFQRLQNYEWEFDVANFERSFRMSRIQFVVLIGAYRAWRDAFLLSWTGAWAWLLELEEEQSESLFCLSWLLMADERHWFNFLRIHFECQCCLTAVVFVVVVLAGLRAYCYCSSWSSGLCECVHFLQLTTAAAASSTVVVVVESKSTSTATTLVFGAGKERRELCFCRLLCSSALPLPAFASTTGSKLAQLPRPPKHPREQPSMVEPSKRLGTHQTTPRPSF